MEVDQSSVDVPKPPFTDPVYGNSYQLQQIDN